jgi:hypothetical protein
VGKESKELDPTLINTQVELALLLRLQERVLARIQELRGVAGER